MSEHRVRRRVLVAGIGNIFCGDDGFGVEVIRRLAGARVPEGVRVADFGIRGVHLAYDILDGAYDQVILVDALPQDAEPGTIAVVDATTVGEGNGSAAAWDAHAMHPEAVLQLLQRIGGGAPEVLVVGCQPGRLDEHMGLSPAVAAAVEEAARVVLGLVSDTPADACALRTKE
jgi:hydrogenase maturation protease